MWATHKLPVSRFGYSSARTAKTKLTDLHERVSVLMVYANSLILKGLTGHPAEPLENQRLNRVNNFFDLKFDAESLI